MIQSGVHIHALTSFARVRPSMRYHIHRLYLKPLPVANGTREGFPAAHESDIAERVGGSRCATAYLGHHYNRAACGLTTWTTSEVLPVHLSKECAALLLALLDWFGLGATTHALTPPSTDSRSTHTIVAGHWMVTAQKKQAAGHLRAQQDGSGHNMPPKEYTEKHGMMDKKHQIGHGSVSLVYG